MGTTTMGVKLDDATRERIKSAATRIDRTPHWLIKQAIFSYLEQLEKYNIVDKRNKVVKEEKRQRENVEDGSYFNGCLTKEDLDIRYKALVKVFHPDAKAGDEDTFKQIKKQYETLQKEIQGGMILKKNYVLDTNILLESPTAIWGFEDNNVFITTTTLQELDDKKIAQGEVGFNARRVNHFIDDLCNIIRLKKSEQ